MPKFSLYSAKLRIGGSVLNEVPLVDVTAPEIDVLRAFHGPDAVIGIKSAGLAEREHAEERERINDLYAGSSNIDNERVKKLRLIRDLFGNDRLPLPLSLENVEDAADEPAVTETKTASRPRRTKIEPEAAFAE